MIYYKLRLKPERLLFADLNMGVVPENAIVEGKDLLPTFSDNVNVMQRYVQTYFPYMVHLVY